MIIVNSKCNAYICCIGFLTRPIVQIVVYDSHCRHNHCPLEFTPSAVLIHAATPGTGSILQTDIAENCCYMCRYVLIRKRPIINWPTIAEYLKLVVIRFFVYWFPYLVSKAPKYSSNNQSILFKNCLPNQYIMTIINVNIASHFWITTFSGGSSLLKYLNLQLCWMRCQKALIMTN